MSGFGQEYEGLNDSQKAAAMTRRIDELEKQNNAAADAIRNAKVELSELPGAAMEERRSKKDYIKGLQRAINANEIEIGMLKEEYSALELQTIDTSYEVKRFNKALCIQNIRTLLSQKGVRLGDIERASGNSPGYLSRLEKPDNTTDPSVEFLANAAYMLGVSLDDLLSSPIEDLSPNDEMLISFIEKLICNTKKDRLTWRAELQLENDFLERDYSEEIYLNKRSEKSIGLGQKENGTEVWSYRSVFFPKERVAIDSAPYHTTINDDDELYIIKCRGSDASNPFYEMYHIPYNDETQPICCTKCTPKVIASRVERLYQQIRESEEHVRLSDTTKSMMEAYISH